MTDRSKNYQSIKNCARCGKSHDNLFVHRFDNQPRAAQFFLRELPEDAEPGTIYGWAKCPEKGSPILFTMFDLPEDKT